MADETLASAYIVRGAYPAPLLAEWDQFDRDMGSESIRPGESPIE